MNMLRILGLLCAAFMTMGSGGVSTATSEPPPVPLEPEYVDAEPAADAADKASNSKITTAPSEGAAAADTLPATETVDDGALIEVSLSDDYIQGRYYTENGLLGFDDAVSHVGVYFSDNRDFIGNVGLMTDPIPLFIPGLTLSVGARGYVALLSEPDDDVVGLAPGVEGRFGLPTEFDFPLAAVGSIFYSPDVLTLGDAEDIIDIDGRVEAEIKSDIVGFIGYRVHRFDGDEGANKKAANEIQVGARFRL